MAVSDEVSVMRAGRMVGHRWTFQTGREELAELMVGRKVSLTIAPPPAPVLGEATLAVTDLSDAEGALKNVSLRVAGGEIVGIAGVEGNGQSELIEAIFHPHHRAGRPADDDPFRWPI